MIDFYKGIETSTGESIPYLKELSASLDNKQTANQNYQKVEEQVEMLGNREALNLLRPDDHLLAEALQKAKRYFLNETNKESYDLLLGIKKPGPQERQDYQLNDRSYTSTALPVQPITQTPPTNSVMAPKQDRKRSLWLVGLTSLASIWLLGLLFVYFNWNVLILVFIISIIVILALLLDS